MKSRFSPARLGLYAFVAMAAAFFLLPAWVMLATSFKPLAEIREGAMFAMPGQWTTSAWRAAWAGMHGGLVNSLQIMVPSVLLSTLVGAVNGYALSMWKSARGNLLLGMLFIGAFIPYQLFIYPLVLALAWMGWFGSLAGIVLVHVIFGMPITTLLFRNYFAGIPPELFNAARIDGAGFWRIFVSIILPLSKPILIVVVLLQVTGIWNDFILGLVFAGRDHMPMTVLLNNQVNTTTGERNYAVDMAATLMTAALPLLVYFFSGRWFVRGITAGAVKG